MKNKNYKNFIFCLIAILLVALFLRVWNVGFPFYSDELPWVWAAADHSHHGLNLLIDIPGEKFIWTSPPLAPMMYRFFTWTIGVSTFTMRLLPLLIGLINILLTYNLAKKIFDKKTALFAAGVMAISFWHILASFIVEHDSSILTLFWLLFFNAYINYETASDAKANKWLIISGVILGFGLLTKFTGGLMLIALCVYIFFKNKLHKHIFYIIRLNFISSKLNFISSSTTPKGKLEKEKMEKFQFIKQLMKQCINPLIIIFAIGIAMLGAFIAWSAVNNPSYLAQTLSHSGVLTLTPSLFSPLRIIIYMLLWATPFLFGMPLLLLLAKDLHLPMNNAEKNMEKSYTSNKNNNSNKDMSKDTDKNTDRYTHHNNSNNNLKFSRVTLLWCWTFTVIVFYVFSKYIAAIDRYMAVMIPALAILSGYVLSRIIDKKNIWKIVFTSAGFLALLILLNLIKVQWIVHDTGEYIRRAISLNWGFVFQFHGSGGPAFMSSFIPLGVGIVVCMILLMAIIVIKIFIHSSNINKVAKNRVVNNKFIKSNNKFENRSKKLSDILIILFIASSIGFNLFIVQSFIIKSPFPNVGSVSQDISSYINTNHDLKLDKIYTTDMNIGWYIDATVSKYYLDKYSNANINYTKSQDAGIIYDRTKAFSQIGDIYTDTQYKTDSVIKDAKDNHALLVIIDYPKKSLDDNVWKIAKECALDKYFSYNGFTLGYVYSC